MPATLAVAPTVDPTVERITRVAREVGHAYAEVEPFPHIVIDDLLPGAMAEAVCASFAQLDGVVWREHMHANSRKYACNDLARLPEEIGSTLLYFNSPAFVEAVSQLTGIPGLSPDPEFVGGGMHLIRRGGFLRIHADFNIHPQLKLDRRLNLILYMNKEWKESYGGHIELWDRTMSRCVQRIAPVFNRCVIFSTTDTSYHGHPDPIQCPRGMSRKSLAVYYYTNGRPERERSPQHDTLYQRRPQDGDARDPLGMRLRATASRMVRGLRGGR